MSRVLPLGKLKESTPLNPPVASYSPITTDLRPGPLLITKMPPAVLLAQLANRPPEIGMCNGTELTALD